MKIFNVLAKNIEARIESRLRIKNAPTWFNENILTAFTYANPEYTEALRFSPYGRVSDKIPKSIALAEVDSEGYLCVPRGLDATQSLMDRSERLFNALQWTDKRQRAPVKFPARLLTPNSSQKKLLAAFESVLELCTRPFGNIGIVAPTSVGKTMAQALMAELTGQRTLVLCVTNFIRDAWLTDLEKLYGLKKKDVGLIQQATWRIGEHFTLASVATLHKRQARWDELLKSIGTVILDEMHVVSEPRIYGFMSQFNCFYHIGASATPKLETNIHVPAIFGVPIKRLVGQHEDTETSMALRGADVTRTNFRYDYDPQNLDYNDLLTELAADEERNALICDSVIKDHEEGHSCLIVVNRKQHLWMLYEMLQERGIKDTNLIYGGTNSSRRRTDLLVKQILSRNVRCIVAIVKAIKLGANLNPLNRLHVATPVSFDDLDQIIGRIRRRDKLKKDTRLRYYRDDKVRYLESRFRNHFVPLMRKMKIPEYVNLFL